MQRCKAADEAAVHLLGERAVAIVCAQTGLDMADGYLRVERGERGGEGRARVAVDKDEIGAKLRKAALKTLERLDGDIGKCLVFAHDIEICVGPQAEAVHHGIEHLAVLRGDADEAFDALAALKLKRERRHFYCFRARAENGHDFKLTHFCCRPPRTHPPVFRAAADGYCCCF